MRYRYFAETRQNNSSYYNNYRCKTMTRIAKHAVSIERNHNKRQANNVMVAQHLFRIWGWRKQIR